ncbi:MAG: hypothetical protein L0G94_15000 [Brachybacterium sp.]|uniref:hypothetical protein n=1 Tax=Brachybacterium sp. TaxID=1891286 RepID=UPI002647FFD5|nr:hypothetical protein [Brachybacterium sp.]MDN5687964.1 hypothetical protein [Brachybacterium sp.]
MRHDGLRVGLLPGVPTRHQVRSHALLEELVGQSIIHTRVASCGTWTVTARGWALHSRIQQKAGPPLIGTTWEAIGGRTLGPGLIAWVELTDVGRDALGPTSVQAMPPGMSGYDSPGGGVGGSR